jgi:hypothetical protein
VLAAGGCHDGSAVRFTSALAAIKAQQAKCMNFFFFFLVAVLYARAWRMCCYVRLNGACFLMSHDWVQSFE